MGQCRPKTPVTEAHSIGPTYCKPPSASYLSSAILISFSLTAELVLNVLISSPNHTRMAEAIGLGASIAGLATFGAQIVTSLRTYASAYQRAEQKINDLSSDLALINSILTDLGASITKYEVKFHITAKNFVDVKKTCERNFVKLNTALKEVKWEDAEAEGGRRKGKAKALGPWQKLKFALGGETELKEFLLSIESSKSTLQLLLESFKLFILLRLHELNEEQMEDIKLLNRKVPVLAKGIQRAGLATVEPRRRHLDQQPAIEPVNVMHVRITDGPSDLATLSVNPPIPPKSLQKISAPAPAPAIYKEVAAHQTDEEEFDPSKALHETSDGLQNGPENLQRRNSPIQREREVFEGPKNGLENFSSQRDPSGTSDDPPSTVGSSLSMISPLPGAYGITMEQNQLLLFDLQKRPQNPNKNPSHNFKHLLGSLKRTNSSISHNRDIVAPGQNGSGLFGNQQGLPRSPVNDETAIIDSYITCNNLPALATFETKPEHQRNETYFEQLPNLLNFPVAQSEGITNAPGRSQVPTSTPREAAADHPHDGEHCNDPPPGTIIVANGLEPDTEENYQHAFNSDTFSLLSVNDDELQDYRSSSSQRESRSPITQYQSQSPRPPSLDTTSLYEGWLLEASQIIHSNPAFTVSCCSRSPIHLHTTSSALWTMHPFSRDTTTLKSRLDAPANTKTQPSGETSRTKTEDGEIVAPPTDARREIIQLLHDRNQRATKGYGWKVAALTPYPYPTPKWRSKLFNRNQTKENAERYLVILRGGPLSASDEAVPKMLRGAKEDLPDRHSNPWSRLQRERIPERELVYDYRRRGLPPIQSPSGGSMLSEIGLGRERSLRRIVEHAGSRPSQDGHPRRRSEAERRRHLAFRAGRRERTQMSSQSVDRDRVGMERVVIPDQGAFSYEKPLYSGPVRSYPLRGVVVESPTSRRRSPQIKGWGPRVIPETRDERNHQRIIINERPLHLDHSSTAKKEIPLERLLRERERQREEMLLRRDDDTGQQGWTLSYQADEIPRRPDHRLVAEDLADDRRVSTPISWKLDEEESESSDNWTEKSTTEYRGVAEEYDSDVLETWNAAQNTVVEREKANLAAKGRAIGAGAAANQMSMGTVAARSGVACAAARKNSVVYIDSGIEDLDNRYRREKTARDRKRVSLIDTRSSLTQTNRASPAFALLPAVELGHRGNEDWMGRKKISAEGDEWYEEQSELSSSDVVEEVRNGGEISDEEARRVMGEFLRGFSADGEILDIAGFLGKVFSEEEKKDVDRSENYGEVGNGKVG